MRIWVFLLNDIALCLDVKNVRPKKVKVMIMKSALLRPRSHSLRWSGLTKTRSSGAVLRWVRTVKVVQEVDFWTAPEDHLRRWSWGTGLIKSGLDRSNVQCERKRTLNGSELVTFCAKHVVRYIRFVFRALKNWPADLSCHSNKTTWLERFEP